MSQALRNRFNNHRNRIKQLCGLYLYHHFNSDGHTLEDVSIMPIEEVVFNKHDRKFKKRTQQRQRKRRNGNEVSRKQKTGYEGISAYNPSMQ